MIYIAYNRKCDTHQTCKPRRAALHLSGTGSGFLFFCVDPASSSGTTLTLISTSNSCFFVGSNHFVKVTKPNSGNRTETVPAARLSRGTYCTPFGHWLSFCCLLVAFLPASAETDKESDALCEGVMKLLAEQNAATARTGMQGECALVNVQPAEYWRCMREAMKKGTSFQESREQCFPKWGRTSRAPTAVR